MDNKVEFSVATSDKTKEVIAGVNVDEHQDMFRKYREEKDQEVENLTELYSSIHDLANLKHQFYQIRQKLVSKKFELQEIADGIGRNFKHQKRDITKSYILGQRQVQKNSAISLKNKDERDTFHEADLRHTIWFMEVLDNQINWTIDTLKTVDNLIFGLPYAIELEAKYKTSI